MQDMLIIADDLTGALDAAAVLRRQGFSASVMLDAAEARSSSDHAADVLAITTETRRLADPAPVLRRLVERLPRGRLLYKKIDSTLRGPIGAELMPLLEWSGARVALVVPAFPAQGRRLVHGNLVVDGVPHDVHLPALLRQQTGQAVAHVMIDDVRAGLNELMAALDRALGTGATCIVADAASDDDLERIARVVAGLEVRPFIAGSAGFAAYLPQAWKLPPPRAVLSPPAVAGTPVLFVLGSPHPRTRAQLQTLRDAGVTQCELTPEQFYEGSEHTVVRACVELLAGGADAVLTLACPADLRIDAVAPERQRRLVRGLARVAGQVIEQTAVASLVLGGGDTAYAVCRELGIGAIVLDGEALPGLPLGHATSTNGQLVRLVTKAGGFGRADALNAVRAVLHTSSQKEACP